MKKRFIFGFMFFFLFPAFSFSTNFMKTLIPGKDLNFFLEVSDYPDTIPHHQLMSWKITVTNLTSKTIPINLVKLEITGPDSFTRNIWTRLYSIGSGETYTKPVSMRIPKLGPSSGFYHIENIIFYNEHELARDGFDTYLTEFEILKCYS